MMGADGMPGLGEQEVTCRHCGTPARVDLDKDPGWFCAACDHWQNAMACPTCGNQVLISLLPPEMVPAPVEPAARKKKDAN